MSQFHITNWTPDGSCANLKTVTDVIEEVGKVQRRTGNNPILAHCRYGHTLYQLCCVSGGEYSLCVFPAVTLHVSRSGMFCAIATTIERCKTEGVVDVFQVVKAVRVQKPGAVRTVVSGYMTINA